MTKKNNLAKSWSLTDHDVFLLFKSTCCLFLVAVVCAVGQFGETSIWGQHDVDTMPFTLKEIHENGITRTMWEKSGGTHSKAWQTWMHQKNSRNTSWSVQNRDMVLRFFSFLRGKADGSLSELEAEYPGKK